MAMEFLLTDWLMHCKYCTGYAVCSQHALLVRTPVMTVISIADIIPIPNVSFMCNHLAPSVIRVFFLLLQGEGRGLSFCL